MLGKALLSHSSADKKLVREVFNDLSANLAELDEQTFRDGLPTWEVILDAFERCSLFVLFVSDSSLVSPWVKREVAEAKRRMKNGSIARVLIFCVGNIGLPDIPKNLQHFTVALNPRRPAVIARTIRRHLLELFTFEARRDDEFVGRDTELLALKQILLDPSRRINGISISGLESMGRQRILARALHDIQPRLLPPDAPIPFEIFQSCADIALEIRRVVSGSIAPEEIEQLRREFVSDDAQRCGENLARMLLDVRNENQYISFTDRGGIINNEGDFTNIIKAIIESAKESDGLFLFLLTNRRPISRARVRQKTMAFLDVGPLSDGQAIQYTTQGARSRKLTLSSDEINRICQFSDGHPANIDYILEKCAHSGSASLALSDVEDIIELKKDRAEHILNSIEIDSNSKRFLGILSLYRNLPGDFISVVFDSFEDGANACLALLDYHLVIESAGTYSLSPPLRDAVQREVKFRLAPADEREVAKNLSAAVEEYMGDSKIPINIIDAGSLALIQSGNTTDNLAHVLILPSHFIYLAKIFYDRRSFQESRDWALKALDYRGSLTMAAYIEACRWLGLSAVRMGDEASMRSALRRLRDTKDSYGVASANFIEGFHLRLRGRFEDAEISLLAALPNMKENFSLLRELAIVNLLQRDFVQAMQYAETACDRAPTNPYALDSLVRAYIGAAVRPGDLRGNFKFLDLLEALRKVGSSDGKTFYQLRQAELLIREGKAKEALPFCDEAVRMRGDLAAPYVMRARARLAAGTLGLAREDRNAARTRSGANQQFRYFDAELVSFEYDYAIRRRDWISAIQSIRIMEQLQLRYTDSAIRELKREVALDRRPKAKDVLAFVRDH